MVSIPPTLGTIPLLVALSVAAGHILAPLAREARLITVAWLALRGTQPDQRADIIEALTGRESSANGKSAKLAPDAAGKHQKGLVAAATPGWSGQPEGHFLLADAIHGRSYPTMPGSSRARIRGLLSHIARRA